MMSIELNPYNGSSFLVWMVWNGLIEHLRKAFSHEKEARYVNRIVHGSE